MWNFFKNPISRYIMLFLVIGGLIALFLYQRERAQHFKFKYESEVTENKRLKDNADALNATIKSYIDKNGNLTSEINAFQLKIEELDGLYKKYFSLYTKEKNKTPKTIIQTEYVVTSNFNTATVVTDSTITYKDSIPYKGNNWTIIEGKIPYTISQHLKKGENFNYAFDNAVLYCYDLQTRGMNDAKVVAFTNGGKEVDISAKDTTMFFRIFLMSSVSSEEKDNIAYKTGLDQKNIDMRVDNGVYYYYTGIFVPNKDKEVLVNAKDLLTYPKLWTGNNQLKVVDGMTLYTGLYKDEKTGKLMIQVKTDHPGVVFNEIRGADILSNDKKVSRAVRKEFGIGLNLGVGGMLTPVDNEWDIKFGPVISLGLNWTPRFLQFGPSKDIEN